MEAQDFLVNKNRCKVSTVITRVCRVMKVKKLSIKRLKVSYFSEEHLLLCKLNLKTKQNKKSKDSVTVGKKSRVKVDENIEEWAAKK